MRRIRGRWMGSVRPLVEVLAGIEPRSSSVGVLFHGDRGAFGYRWFGCRVLVSRICADGAVRAGRAVRLPSRGYGVFVESSPHPVLLAGVEDIAADGVPAMPVRVVVVPSLGRDDGGLQRFWMSVGRPMWPGWGWIGRRCSPVVAPALWTCRRMRFSGNGFGWPRGGAG